MKDALRWVTRYTESESSKSFGDFGYDPPIVRCHIISEGVRTVDLLQPPALSSPQAGQELTPLDTLGQPLKGCLIY